MYLFKFKLILCQLASANALQLLFNACFDCMAKHLNQARRSRQNAGTEQHDKAVRAQLEVQVEQKLCQHGGGLCMFDKSVPAGFIGCAASRCHRRDGLGRAPCPAATQRPADQRGGRGLGGQLSKAAAACCGSAMAARSAAQHASCICLAAEQPFCNHQP